MRYLNAAHTRAQTSHNTRNITKKEFVLEKSQDADQEESFYHSFNSKFMPVEHFGVDPNETLIQFMRYETGEARQILPSKSPLYNRPIPPEAPEPGDDDQLLIESKINSMKKQDEIYEKELAKNQEFIQCIFNSANINKKQFLDIKGQNYIRQHAKKYKSAFKMSLERSGQINSRCYQDTKLEKKSDAIRKRVLLDDNIDQIKKDQILQRLQENRQKMSLTDSLSTNYKVENLRRRSKRDIRTANLSALSSINNAGHGSTLASSHSKTKALYSSFAMPYNKTSETQQSAAYFDKHNMRSSSVLQ